MNSLSSPVPDNWYETYFTAPFNRFWESVVPESITQAEVSFIEKHLRLNDNARVLDVPCGSGRHGIELARRGYRVVGVDISQDAVERARSAVADLPFEVLLQDMSRLDVTGPFDGAFCFGNSFGYLSHDDMLKFVRSISASLRPGGRFAVDTGTTAESILPTMKTEARYEANGYVFEIRNDYDVERSRLVTQTTLRRDSQEWRQGFSHAVYTCAELDRLFRVAGLKVVARLADLDETSYRLGRPRLLLIGERV